MRVYSLFIWIFLSSSFKVQQHNKHKFYITFGSCFKSTKVDLNFNKVVQFNAIELTSDFSTGVVMDKRIDFDGNSLKYTFSKLKVDEQPLKIVNGQFLLEVTSDGVTKKFNIELKKGMYIFLEKCGPNRTFEIKQYKKPPIIE